jgi:hypothetical protein
MSVVSYNEALVGFILMECLELAGRALPHRHAAPFVGGEPAAIVTQARALSRKRNKWVLGARRL